MAISAILLGSLSRRIETTRYNYPNEIDPQRSYDFILVGSLESIAEAILVYRRQGRPVPALIHLVNPTVRDYLHYETRFPDVLILPVSQGNLEDMTETLRFDDFAKAIHAIESRQG
jgi:hypothetical protein